MCLNPNQAIRVWERVRNRWYVPAPLDGNPTPKGGCAMFYLLEALAWAGIPVEVPRVGFPPQTVVLERLLPLIDAANQAAALDHVEAAMWANDRKRFAEVRDRLRMLIDLLTARNDGQATCPPSTPLSQTCHTTGEVKTFAA